MMNFIEMRLKLHNLVFKGTQIALRAFQANLLTTGTISCLHTKHKSTKQIPNN